MQHENLTTSLQMKFRLFLTCYIQQSLNISLCLLEPLSVFEILNLIYPNLEYVGKHFAVWAPNESCVSCERTLNLSEQSLNFILNHVLDLIYLETTETFSGKISLNSQQLFSFPEIKLIERLDCLNNWRTQKLLYKDLLYFQI